MFLIAFWALCNALPLVVPRSCSTNAPAYSGLHLIAWQHSNLTLATMILEMYFDAPLLPRSYFHDCSPTSAYGMHIYQSSFHNVNASFAKTNVFSTPAPYCVPHYTQEAALKDCACRFAREYGQKAFIFIMMRAAKDGTAPAIDVGELTTAARIDEMLDQFVSAFHVRRRAISNETMAEMTSIAVDQSPPPPSSYFEFAAKYAATMTSCFVETWSQKDYPILERYFPEMIPYLPQTLRSKAPSGSSLPPNVYVIIPTKNPQNITFTMSTMLNRADRTFGAIQFHFGIDWGDNATRALVMSTCDILNAQCRIHDVYARGSDVSAIANHVFVTIEERGYFFRYNDDTEMMTENWNRLGIEALRREPIDAGLAYVIDIRHEGLETHSMVSSVHKDVFGYYFPHHFKNYFEDDWITLTYRDELAKSSGIRIFHHAVKERYSVMTVPKDVLDLSVAAARARIARHIAQHPEQFYIKH